MITCIEHYPLLITVISLYFVGGIMGYLLHRAYMKKSNYFEVFLLAFIAGGLLILFIGWLN